MFLHWQISVGVTLASYSTVHAYITLDVCLLLIGQLGFQTVNLTSSYILIISGSIVATLCASPLISVFYKYKAKVYTSIHTNLFVYSDYKVGIGCKFLIRHSGLYNKWMMLHNLDNDSNFVVHFWLGNKNVLWEI